VVWCLPRDVPARGAHDGFDLRQPDRAKVKFNGKPEAAARYGACWCSGKLRYAPVVGESDGLLVLLSFRTKKLLPPTTSICCRN